ncbi:hypothetical protein CXB49_00350 [Chromobacterium sp. ATCC 53434]|uniref:2Fe-2S iron-sulfur cluster-binding protein n=1 Tax=Chromobacterium TaxID=535 RepID=UPI000C7949F5|nr:2Fe-2S iron-sulfur cluster binding domain-containing protein [Chromobacterium sp. ATCC 53434]AUH49396.1 hypothetical protein CXB49_00350 [Chromobacterium sp. ATCC 53434]
MNATPPSLSLRVTFRGTDYVGDADPDKSILENIEEMLLPIPSSCRRGLCGSCRVQLASGELHPQKHVLEKGHVLSCSSLLLGDAHVIIPD